MTQTKINMIANRTFQRNLEDALQLVSKAQIFIDDNAEMYQRLDEIMYMLKDALEENQ